LLGSTANSRNAYNGGASPHLLLLRLGHCQFKDRLKQTNRRVANFKLSGVNAYRQSACASGKVIPE
jgi:hypothetical protein